MTDITNTSDASDKPSAAFLSDVEAAKTALETIEREWEGKKSVLRLKEANYNWRQMEW